MAKSRKMHLRAEGNMEPVCNVEHVGRVRTTEDVEKVNCERCKLILAGGNAEAPTGITEEA